MNIPDWSPGTLLQTSGNYWLACTLHAAVKLDLFSELAQVPKSAEQVARKLSYNPRSITMLLDALVAMSLLVKQDRNYDLTGAARKFLSRSSERYIGHMIMHHHHLVASWAQLDEAVKTGRPVRSRTDAGSDQRREAFLLGMYNQASQQAPQIVSQIDLTRHRKLLDLGGGPGTYAIHFCKHNPQLEAVVFDLPTTKPFAEKVIARHGLTSRIKFIAGDYAEDDLSDSYDAVWLSHILHAEGRDVCQNLVAKAASVLDHDGKMIIHDFFLTDSMDAPLFPALFALNMLLGTDDGQSYSESQIRQMMERAGLTKIVRLPYQGPTESGIICGLRLK
jgi:SAM-dependent methyltransferase